eukprot:CAMPEP_0182449698 /NCGR_PEP_ID=MMETSP1172-20130603/36097_1 /TAXON_ID=708627 /ORGANISM="Timspurckia oligopyrenoides, Strain CCMP3278" /LENGTH=421 /DNA_ID=CAMNT_0024647051 /DNA_START=1392 /DNA_END=2653 /DNA_ORIENTATION=+
MDELYQWLQSHGAEWNIFVSDSNCGGGRTLRAQKSILPGDLLLRVPLDLLISPNTALNDPGPLGHFLREFPHSLIQDSQDSIKNLYLVLFLLHHRALGKTSKWFPFLNVQPKSFSSPLQFTPDDFTWLEGTPLHPMALAVLEELHDIHEKVMNYVGNDCVNGLEILPKEAQSFDWFIWAVSIVDSRAFRLVINGEDTTVFVPLADMANHSSKGTRFDRVLDTNSQELFVRYQGEKELKENEELLFCYSKLTSWQMLLYYGFVVENNVDDSLEFSIPSVYEENEEEDFESQVKKQLFLSMFEDEFTSEFSIEWNRDESVEECSEIQFTNQMMPSLRLMLMDGRELENVTISNVLQILSEKVSDRNEIRVLEALANLFEAMLNTYPTTLDEDTQILNTQRQTLSENQKHCLFYRIGQKRLIDL